MEAPRGAREPTGTNGPTLNTNTSTTYVYTAWLTDTERVLVATIRITTNTNPHAKRAANTRAAHARGIEVNMVDYLVVVIAAGKRPASIPNLEAKPASADGTAPGRVWERRTPPQHTQRLGPGTHTVPGPNLYILMLARRASGRLPRRCLGWVIRHLDTIYATRSTRPIPQFLAIHRLSSALACLLLAHYAGCVHSFNSR